MHKAETAAVAKLLLGDMAAFDASISGVSDTLVNSTTSSQDSDSDDNHNSNDNDDNHNSNDNKNDNDDNHNKNDNDNHNDDDHNNDDNTVAVVGDAAPSVVGAEPSAGDKRRRSRSPPLRRTASFKNVPGPLARAFNRRSRVQTRASRGGDELLQLHLWGRW